MTVTASLQAAGTVASARGFKYNYTLDNNLPEVAAEVAVAAAEVTAEAAADVAEAPDPAETPETAAAISSVSY